MQQTSTKPLRVSLFLLSIWMVLPACCPSGVYQDNFGAVYQLITNPASPDGELPNVQGTVDTGEIGCGVWTLEGFSTKPEPAEERLVVWDVVNPNQNPTDACCYAFHFEGQVTGPACLFISGTYTMTGGKCTQSGPMYLEAL